MLSFELDEAWALVSRDVQVPVRKTKCIPL